MAYTSLFKVSLALFLFVSYISDAQTNPICRTNWSYFAKSNKCLKVFGGGGDGIPLKTWAQAEEFCNLQGGHLASVDSDEEITTIVHLVHSLGYDDGYLSRVHIGLSFSSVLEWIRPDGSRLEYLKWHTYDNDRNIDGRYPCGTLCTSRRWTGYMMPGEASETYPFVCGVDPVTDGK